VQPGPLLHQSFDQVVIVSKADLVLVEGSLLAYDQRVGVLLVQLGLQKFVRNIAVVVIVALQLGLRGTLQSNDDFIGLGSNCGLHDTTLEIGRNVVLLVHHSLREFDHLLFDDGDLTVVLKHFDQRLSSNGRREVLAR
jgi:hypothetical protein